ncbi:hypothetical protein WJX73_006567 [Symbiochloris irregularis]|uniref:AP2/ERF domain-containing protein n=1 Tax=Symbiochloris irregularis TaxID=706552 RepID=A0AAW1NUY8_9CHLO
MVRGYWRNGNRFQVQHVAKGQISKHIGSYRTEEEAREAAKKVYAEFLQQRLATTKAARASEAAKPRPAGQAAAAAAAGPNRKHWRHVEADGDGPYSLPRSLPGRQGLQRGYSHHKWRPSTGGAEKRGWRIRIRPLQGYGEANQSGSMCPPGTTEQQAFNMAMQEFCRVHRTTVEKVRAKVAAYKRSKGAPAPVSPGSCRPSLMHRRGRPPKRKSPENNADDAVPLAKRRGAHASLLANTGKTTPLRNNLGHFAGSIPSVKDRDVEVLWSDAAVAVLTQRQLSRRQPREAVQILNPKELEELEDAGI